LRYVFAERNPGDARMVSANWSVWRRLWALPLIACAASGAAAQNLGLAVKIGFDAETDGDRPFPVQNYSVHAQFDAFLNPDGSASADLVYAIPLAPPVHFSARLNGGPSPAPGGYAGVNMISKNHYQMTWELPTNQVVLDVFEQPGRCKASIILRLRPGDKEYTWYLGIINYCSRINIKKISCETN
jgi:hypothetical protein